MTKITFGALAPSLREQISARKGASKEIQLLQRCVDGLTLLAIHGFVTEAECHRARVRLTKSIANLEDTP